MNRNPLVGPNLVVFKASDELVTMLEAVARFEKRNKSDVCRLALHEFFQERGYYEPAMLALISRGAEKAVESLKRPGEQ